MDARQVTRTAAGPAFLALLLACGGDDGPTEPTGTPNLRPVAAFTTDVTEGAAPLEVRFDASASTDPDGSIVSYAWAFGDGATGTGRTTTHSYADEGSYTPQLTVTDERGASDTENGAPITVNSPPGSGRARIAGVVWHDANADGVQGDDEHPIPAMIVFLDENEDGLRDSTETAQITGDDGTYVFEGLDERRSYTVTQELAIGWTNTAPGLASAEARTAVPALAARAEDPSGAGAGATAQPAAPEPPLAAIIGGAEAEPGAFPFQVALVTSTSRSQFCGGTFVHADWVLTAAHCVVGTDPEAVQVLAGAHNKRTDGELIDVERIHVHPAYTTQAAISSDVALLRLAGRHMRPRIELLTPAGADLAAPGTMATTIGWGLTQEGGSSSDVLKQLEAEIISNDECRTHLGASIIASTICAGKLGSSESICSGDSGGPLMVPHLDRWMQVGITSFGTAICYQPSAYARVSALIDYPLSLIDPERSGAVLVEWTGGVIEAVVNFGNFR